MLYSVQKANEKLRLDPELGKNTQIFSMDAEALFPSLDLEDIITGIRTLVMESDLDIAIDTREVAKYVSIMYDSEEARNRNVISCLPLRDVEMEGMARG